MMKVKEEEEIIQSLSDLVVKLLNLEKAHKNVNGKVDNKERDEYTTQDFRSNERNEH